MGDHAVEQPRLWFGVVDINLSTYQPRLTTVVSNLFRPPLKGAGPV